MRDDYTTIQEREPRMTIAAEELDDTSDEETSTSDEEPLSDE